MKDSDFRHLYGPVPSRRLGRSLGIDLVPFKTCTYDCIYCQLGRTTNKTIERKEYVAAEEVLVEVERKLAAEPAPDFISLAGSGEPTLNDRIGDLIVGIKNLTSIPVAVLTNGSLLWMREVQDDLMAADLVLPSLDAGHEHLFQCVNRPDEALSFERMVTGLAEFTERFRGSVWLEVFLLAGVTGIQAEVEKIATLTRRIRPDRVQLNTVSRPPAEEFVFAVAAEQMERFRELFPATAEVITETLHDESLVLSARAAIDTDILSLLRRRPCTLRDVALSLGIHPNEAAKCLDVLGKAGKITKIFLNGGYFYSPSRNICTTEIDTTK